MENKKEVDLSAWYIELVKNAELMDYSPVKGFYVYRPYLYAMWEKYMEALNKEIKKEGVQNAYFPLLIPESLLSKEKEHVEGFTPEVAWVTEAGDRKLEERYAVRPTSETIMYSIYSGWIKSYRDLPLKINQWNSMVRWETKETRFLLRQRENLWQEGHSVFATAEEADADARKMLDIYAKIIKDLFAIPFFTGRKSEAEKFAGAVKTYTIETIFDNGFASQIATSHFLGQNFSKAFDIKFVDEKNEWHYAYQDSWGSSTRLLGAMIIIHSDNKGLVLPPKIAPLQFIIIPVSYTSEVIELCDEISNKIVSYGFTSKVDKDNTRTPGWKFNQYELLGVPFRITIGEKEVKDKRISIKRRFDGKEIGIEMEKLSKEFIGDLINTTQEEMYQKAKDKMMAKIKEVYNKEEALNYLKNNTPIITAWCGNEKCEANIKEATTATSRAILDESPKQDVCVFCGEKARYTALFAKSY